MSEQGVGPLPPQLMPLVERARADARVLAAWVEGLSDQGPHRVELHLALDETGLASFWAERRDWLLDIAPVHVQDILHPWTGALALTEGGWLLVMVIEPWGGLPERFRQDVSILFDKTGRLDERLRLWEPPERVDFHLLDELAAEVWISLWFAAIIRGRDDAGFVDAVAAAWRAYLAFTAACEEEDVHNLAWKGALAIVAGVGDRNVRSLSPEALATTVADLMSTHGRALGEARGWQYPVGLERAVRRIWEEGRGTT